MKRVVAKKHVYRLLGSSPLVVISAKMKKEKRLRMCTVAWCMPLDFDPPKAAIVLSRENTTAAAVIESGELVINIPGAELAREVLGIGSTSSVDVDKLEKFGLHIERSSKVACGGIKEALANLECRVIEWKTPLGKKLRSRFDLILVEIVHARADKKLFSDRWHPEKGANLLLHLGGETLATIAPLK